MRTLLVLAILFWNCSAQSQTPFKAYKSAEDYCRENPKMPTCINGRPVRIEDSIIYQQQPLNKPLTGAPSRGGTARGASHSQARPEMSSVGQVALQDWRFSHSSPAMLININ